MPPRRKRPPPPCDPAADKRAQKLAEASEFEAETATVFAQLAEESEEQELGMLPIPSLEEALLLLDLDCSPRDLKLIGSTLDPEGSGYATYEDFKSACVAKRRARAGSRDGAGEADRAFNLFLEGRADGGAGGDGGDALSISDLRRVSKDLAGRGLGVDEQILGDMLRVAAGVEDLDVPADRIRVDRDQFGELMSRLSRVR